MRKTLQTGAVSAAVTLLLFGCATTAGAQAQSRFVFDLPGERLSQALRDVALQTGRDVIAPDDLVQARRAAPLSGTFTPEEAFQRLLRGSGLRYRLVGNSIIIERDPLSPGADVAGSADDKPADVVVTGTHVRGGPSTSPLIVLTRKDIDRTGATSIDELMRVVPQNSQGGVNKENSLVPLPDQDVTDHGAGINLRGLGQRATLVLLNGRRMAPSGSGSFVDVSLIPASALQRVEILTDGASAIYGSDAVGGVVNFVLRDRFEGLETSAQAGAATQGGGSEFLFSQTAGKNWGSGHGLAAYEFRAENEVRAGEREFTINLPNATYLLPRERKQSLLATLEQELAPGLRAGLTATFAHRATDRTVFQTISPLPVGVDAKATSATVSSELTYDLPNGWGVHVDGNYAFSKTTQRQTQPGGIPLVNARDVRNSIIEGEARIDGALIKLPGGPVRIALGGQVRSEDYRDGFKISSFPAQSAALGARSAPCSAKSWCRFFRAPTVAPDLSSCRSLLPPGMTIIRRPDRASIRKSDCYGRQPLVSRFGVRTARRSGPLCCPRSPVPTTRSISRRDFLRQSRASAGRKHCFVPSGQQSGRQAGDVAQLDDRRRLGAVIRAATQAQLQLLFDPVLEPHRASRAACDRDRKSRV